jgi:hypothetical protein
LTGTSRGFALSTWAVRCLCRQPRIRQDFSSANIDSDGDDGLGLMRVEDCCFNLVVKTAVHRENGSGSRCSTGTYSRYCRYWHGQTRVFGYSFPVQPGYYFFTCHHPLHLLLPLL